MNKNEFLEFLRSKLKKFDINDIDDIVNYYDEYISDIVKEGLSEEEAVKSLGSCNIILSNIVSELVEKDSKKNAFKGLHVTLGLCFSPVLLPLLASLGAVVVAVFAVWIAFTIAFGASAFAFLASSIATFFISDYGIWGNIFICGACLMIGSVFSLITYWFVKVTYKLVSKIVIKINELIKKIINRREIKQNESIN